MVAEGVFPKADGDIYYGSEANDAFYGSKIGIFMAGENITAGNAVYINLSDGKVYVGDTGTANDIRANGMAVETFTTGNTGRIILAGRYVTSGLTAQNVYYLGASGAISTTKNNIRIGVAQSTTILIVDIIQPDKSPISSIMPWDKTATNCPALSAHWVQANGQVLSDTESPLNGNTIPNLNGNNNFLRGNSTSGGTGGSETHTHTVPYPTLGTNSGSGSAVYGNDDTENNTGSGSSLPPYYNVVWIYKIK